MNSYISNNNKKLRAANVLFTKIKQKKKENEKKDAFLTF